MRYRTLMSVNCQQNGKPIALLFNPKFPISNLSLWKTEIQNFNVSQLSAKWQAYSLTFDQKLPNYVPFHCGTSSYRTLMSVNFQQNGKLIALLFDQKLPGFTSFHCGRLTFRTLMSVNFQQNGNPIALLFDQKLPNFVPFHCGAKSYRT